MKKKILQIIKFLILFLMIFLNTDCNKKDPLTPEERAWLKEHDGKIILAAEPKWPPVSFFEDDGAFAGIVVDYLRLIERRLGFRFKIQKMESWEQILEKAQIRQVDVIMDVVSTPERSKYLNFTEPYIEIPTVLITRKDRSGSLTLNQMEGLKIAVVEGFAIIDYIKENYPELELIYVSNNIDGLNRLSGGEFDVVIAELTTASYIIEKEGIRNLRIAGFTGHTYRLSIGSRKDWPILNRILSKGLSLISEKERKEIRNKWITLGKEKTPIRWEIPAGIAILLFAGILLFFIFRIGLSGLKEKRIRKGGKMPGWRTVVLILLPVIAGIILSILYQGGFFSRDPLTPEERAWLKEYDSKIRLSSDPHWPPMAFFDEHGIKTGIVPDYIKLIESKLNFRFKRVPLDAWSKVIKSAKEKKIDVISAANKNPERSKYLNFTEAYFEIRTAIIVRKEFEKSLTLEEMGSMKVALTKGSAMHDYIKNNYKDVNLAPYPDDTEALMKLASNEVDAVALDLATASYLIQKRKITNLRIAGYIPFKYNIRIASRKDWPILNSILEKGLSLISENEKEEIRNRWITLGEEKTPLRWELPAGIVAIISVGILLFFIFRSRLSGLRGKMAKRERVLLFYKRIKRRRRWTAALILLSITVLIILFIINRDYFSETASLTPEEITWLKEYDGKIKFAPDDAYPPFEFFDENGAYTGISTDYIRLIEKKLNFKFDMVRLKNWDEIIKKAQLGEIDVISSAQKTPQRSEYMLFTEPYIEVPSVIITRKEVKEHLSLDKMTGMKIAVVKNYAVEDFIRENYAYLDLYPVSDPLSGLISVSFNNTDAIVIDLPVASYYIAEEGITNLRMAGDTGYKESLRIASKKDLPILNRILDKGLALITQDERDAILQKWIHLEQEPFYKKRGFWIVAGGSAVVVFFFMLTILAWNRSLKNEVRERTRALNRELEERKQAEEALRRERDLIARITETSPSGITVVNCEGQITFANPRAEQVLGLIKDKITHRTYNAPEWHITDYDGNPFPKEQLPFWQVMNTAQPVFDIRHAIVWPGGQRVLLSINAAPLFNKEGRLDGMVATVEDITARIQAEQQLQRYAAELKEANAELSQYAYVVSHDLKAPLRAIRNYADFLREDLETVLEDDQKMYLNGLDHALREANTLIDDILQLSQIGRKSIATETIEVGAFLRSLISSLDFPARVEFAIKDDWPALDTEPILFRQIFQNLIGNAVKFNTSSPKRVELGWQPVGAEQYEFFVRDNGIGLDPSHQEKIFRIFERLHTKEEYEGTGIGLAIVKKAVGKLGGSIRVESNPGEGSTFFVILPKTKAT